MAMKRHELWQVVKIYWLTAGTPATEILARSPLYIMLAGTPASNVGGKVADGKA